MKFIGRYLFQNQEILGDAAVRQKIYYDRDTAPHHFKKGDWVNYWHKPTAMQTLSSGWTGPFVVAEKVSVVEYSTGSNCVQMGQIISS